MVNLDARIAAAVTAALKSADPRFQHYLEICGLAALLRTASGDLILDYNAAGELALDRCLLEYFIEHKVPWACRRTIKKRVLSAPTFEYLITATWPQLESVGLADLPTDLIYIFLGAMLAAAKGEVVSWFQSTFGPLVDAAALEYTALLEECEKPQGATKRVSGPGGEPSPKRARHDYEKRKLALCAQVVQVLIGRASSVAIPTPTISVESTPDDDQLEELQVMSILYPAALLEGSVLSPRQPATGADIPTLHDDETEEQVSAILSPASYSTSSGILTSKPATFPSLSTAQEWISKLPATSNQTRPLPSFRRSRAPSPPSPPVSRPQFPKTVIPAPSYKPTPNLSARTLGPTNRPAKAMLLNTRAPAIVHRMYAVPPSSSSTSLSDRFRANYQQASFF
ncbi:hypothetical protein DFH06DRAFT_1398085 [Mycena polygramma]|nr:hypothetical protein DFH06DRAFT_1398085 [Mycena polygramma]